MIKKEDVQNAPQNKLKSLAKEAAFNDTNASLVGMFLRIETKKILSGTEKNYGRNIL